MTSYPFWCRTKNMSIIFFELSDLVGSPRVKADLPFFRTGDKVNLKFHLERQHLGRREILDVSGEHLITSSTIDLSYGKPRQIVRVASTGKAPAWKAIKHLPRRQLPPAKSPPTIIE